VRSMQDYRPLQLKANGPCAWSLSLLCSSDTVALRLVALTADGCLPWIEESVSGIGGIPITRCLVRQVMSRGKANRRGCRSRAVRSDRFDVGRDCLLKLSV